MVKVKTPGNILEAYKKLLKEMSLRELQMLARECDYWFGTAGKRRFKLSSASKDVLISWIMGNDPIFEKGGLVDFLKNNMKHYH